MTKDEKRNKEIKRIEQMFRQADEAYSGFSESKQLSTDLRERNNASDSENVSATEKTSMDLCVENYIWVSGVLEDLAKFAELNGLLELEACLKDAHTKTGNILDKMKGQ